MRGNSPYFRLAVVCLFSAMFGLSVFAQSEKQTAGSLRMVGPDGAPVGMVPLKSTAVRAEVAGLFTRVTVTQTFQNPFDRTIEATYNFPLPNDAAVDDMRIVIGSRVVRGVVMEKKTAQAAYEKAKGEGKVTALLEQQRPNLFTQLVANITPGAEIEVMISYVETLNYADDTYEFTFPMTIGERYIPSTMNFNDAEKIATESRDDPGHRISIEMVIEAGVPIQGVASNTHEIEVDRHTASKFVVRLKNDGEIPNRDFRLSYKTAGTKIEDAIVAHKSGDSGFFTLILQPPDRVMPGDTMPKEIVFVMDTSGSMSGFPIDKAKEAMNLTLDHLNPSDTFNLITFAGETDILFDRPVPATSQNLKAARKMLNDSSSGGGTEMMKAIRAALAPSGSQSHVRIVCFMTDGQVGNDNEILAEIKKYSNARVFAFGIGGGVNRHLLDEMSREGRGEAQYVGMNDDGSAAAKQFFERIRNPLMTDINVGFSGVPVTQTYPNRMPDLFDAKPVVVVGRYEQSGRATITLSGRMQGQPFTRDIEIDLPGSAPENDSLRSIWARRRVAELSSEMLKAEKKDELAAEILELGLKFRLMTDYTSFVAVDEQPVTDGSPAEKVTVPNASPDNRQYADPNVTYAGTGGVTAMVEVTSNESIVNSSNASVSTNVQTRTIENLPINGRSIQSLVVLTPGTAATGGQLMVSGNRATVNTFTVDGVDANSGVGTGSGANIGGVPALTAAGGTNNLATIEGIEELRISTAASAEFGRSSGSQLQIVTRSGSNVFRGSLFETFGNEALNANNAFAVERGLDRAPARLNQFGGSLSGPIRRDKFFFFGNYEGLRLRQPGFGVSEVPDAATRNAANGPLGDLLNAFPIANGSTTAFGLAEFAAVYANPAGHDVFSFRLDGQLSDEWRFDARYGLSASKADIRGFGGTSLNTIRRSDELTNAFNLSSTYTVTSSFLIEGRVGLRLTDIGQRYVSDSFGGSRPIDASDGFTSFSFGGRNSTIATGSPLSTRTNGLDTRFKASWARGDHVINLGSEYRRIAFLTGAETSERVVRFAGARTDGIAASILEMDRLLADTSSHSRFAAFITDAWRVHPRFTVDLGLRWDGDIAPKMPATDSPIAGASVQLRNDLANFSPRAGFAWDVFGQGKAVVRASAGLYFDSAGPAATGSFVNSSPFASGRFVRDGFFNDPATEAFTPYILFDEDVRSSRTLKVFTEYQHEAWMNTVVSAAYQGIFSRGLLLNRTSVADDPSRLIRVIDGFGTYDRHAGELRVERRFDNRFSLFGVYTFAKSIDNVSADSFDRWNYVGNDLTLERGPSDQDVRHMFSFHGSYRAPRFFDSGWRSHLLRDWTISGFVNARTALPFTPYFERIEDLGTSVYRLDLTGNTPFIFPGGRRSLDPAAFAIPGDSRQGTIGRNAFRGHRFAQLDLGLSRDIVLRGESKLYLSVRVMNALNTVNLGEIDGRLGTLYRDEFAANPYFGQTVSTLGSGDFSPFYLYGGPRTVQLSAKFSF
jgi:Ca-activated chloride channel family protein